jgi:hypothetical protein
MNNAPENLAGQALRERTRAIRQVVENLVSLEAEIALGLQAALAGAHLDEEAFARLVQARCAATRETIMLIFRSLGQLDRRISQIESRVSDLAMRAADQQNELRMICSVLKEIDDPYGFGLSLDERILGEAAQGPGDDQE